MRILFVFLTESNWCVDLAVMYNLRSKLINIIVQGVFWPVVESLRGVWDIFFPLTTLGPGGCFIDFLTKKKESSFI